MHKSEQGAAKFVEGMKVPHIQSGHPLVFHRTEPALNLGLLCRRIGMAVTDRGADPCGKQLHLVVFIGRAVVEIKPGRPAELRNGGFNNRHQVNEVVVEKDIDTGDEPAGVVDQGDHVNAVFFPILCLQPWAGGGITAPDLVDVGTFVTTHILIARELFRKFHLVNETEHGRFRQLAIFDRTFILQLSEDLGCGKAGIGVFKETDLLVKRVVDFPADATVRAACWEQSVKPGIFIGKMPFLDGTGGIMADLAVRSFNASCRDITIISPQGFIVFLCAGDEWRDGGVAHKGNRLAFVLVHKEPSFQDFSTL